MAARTTRTIMDMASRMTIEAPQTFAKGKTLAEALAADGAVSTALFAWFSPAFPTGGFAYSHGLEAAAAEGLIGDERGLAAWLEGVLMAGGGWNDAVLLNAAHSLATGGDEATMAELSDLALALAPSRERLAETVGQGQAFRAAVAAGWPQAICPGLPERVAYPIAAGTACALIGAAAQTALTAYLTGFCANLIAAGVRLSLTGQTGGVRILSGLNPVIVEIAGRAAASTLDDLGGCAMGADVAAMRHETLHTRLFIS